MAAPLRIGFGSRKIWTERIKNYQCTNFHAFVQICTFSHVQIPLTALIIDNTCRTLAPVLKLPFSHATALHQVTLILTFAFSLTFRCFAKRRSINSP